MATAYDVSYQGPVVSCDITETVVKGNCLILDSSNHWPHVLVSTGDTVLPVGTALAAGITGQTIPVLLNGTLVTCYGTATEGSPIAPSSSGNYQVCASGDIACGLALETATASSFLALMFGVGVVVKA